MADLCEVCGNRDSAFIVLIEGAKLLSCPSCARGGKILHSLNDQAPLSDSPITYEKRPPKAFREEETIVDNYGSIIRSARNKKGLKREEVAKSINEKESYLEHIEKEKTLPPFKVLRKLEKFFEIKLIEKTSPSLVDQGSLGKDQRGRAITLADMLDEQLKEKKKKEE